MRDALRVYLNGKAHDVSGAEAFMQLGDWLRYQRGLTGTKIVCAEGDCGACTVLVSRLVDKKLTPFRSVNSCISFMYLLDRCHVVTVEGLSRPDQLHPAQQAMVEANGAQCGFCTPGFVCALAGLAEDHHGAASVTPKQVKNALTGNLCRCTGYDDIIKAGLAMDLKPVQKLVERFNHAAIEKDLASLPQLAVSLSAGEKKAYLPATLVQAIQAPAMKLTSGATDLGVLSNKGKLTLTETMSLNNISSLYRVHEEKDFVMIGAKASLTEIEKALKASFPEFVRMLHIFASPQIKNVATLVGNIINASPISDTVPFLRVAEAELALLGTTGERLVNINDFIKGGYKELDLLPGEIVTLVKIPKRRGTFKLYKVSKRRDMDISAVTFAAYVELIGDEIGKLSLAFGGVGPSVLRLPLLEKMAAGQTVSPALARQLAKELPHCFKPLSDVRGSAEYRTLVCQNLMVKFFDELQVQVAGGHYVASV